MRKNLSEELKLNDVITLDDGSESKEEMLKGKEELEKEVQKDLEEKQEVAIEIGEDNTPKAEANDCKGKSLKIKQFVEKLILEEPKDMKVLNEEIDTHEFEERQKALSEVYNALARYARFLYFDMPYQDDDDIETFNIFEELESVCEEAVIRLEDGEWV